MGDEVGMAEGAVGDREGSSVGEVDGVGVESDVDCVGDTVGCDVGCAVVGSDVGGKGVGDI